MAEDEKPRDAMEADLLIRESTMRQLIDDGELMIKEAKLALTLIESCVDKLRERHAQITTALARVNRRGK